MSVISAGPRENPEQATHGVTRDQNHSNNQNKQKKVILSSLSEQKRHLAPLTGPQPGAGSSRPAAGAGTETEHASF